MSNWKNDPRLRNIDPAKLILLEKLSSNMDGKNPSELMPILMAAISKANTQGLHFNKDEMDLIMEILTENMAPEEMQKVQKMLALFNSMQR